METKAAILMAGVAWLSLFSGRNEVKKSWVIIPASGLAELRQLLGEMEKENSEIPARGRNGLA